MGKFKFTKPEKSFILYDVGNSAFTLMSTAILPLYFAELAQNANISATDATGYWATAVSVSTAIIAVLYPFLGAFADIKGNKKKLFSLFFGLGLFGNFLFGFTSHWLVLLGLFIFANIGYSGSLVFYDSMLTDVTNDSRMDKVSSYAYGVGYAGSSLPFLISIGLVFFADKMGIGSINATRISFYVIAVWWALFTLPILKNFQQIHYIENTEHNVRHVIKKIFTTIKTMRSHKSLWLFILAYFFYIDGVHAIISMATIYAMQVGLEKQGLILALLTTQFVAFVFAILFAHWAKIFGTRKMLLTSILGYTCIAIFAIFLQFQWQFWVLAILVGVFQGSIQALSRSYFGKLVPKENSNEYFGFFDIFGKYASFMGTAMFGAFAFAGRPEVGVGAISLLFITGFIIFIKIPKNAADAVQGE